MNQENSFKTGTVPNTDSFGASMANTTSMIENHQSLQYPRHEPQQQQQQLVHRQILPYNPSNAAATSTSSTNGNITSNQLSTINNMSGLPQPSLSQNQICNVVQPITTLNNSIQQQQQLQLTNIRNQLQPSSVQACMQHQHPIYNNPMCTSWHNYHAPPSSMAAVYNQAHQQQHQVNTSFQPDGHPNHLDHRLQMHTSQHHLHQNHMFASATSATVDPQLFVTGATHAMSQPYHRFSHQPMQYNNSSNRLSLPNPPLHYSTTADKASMLPMTLNPSFLGLGKADVCATNVDDYPTVTKALNDNFQTETNCQETTNAKTTNERHQPAGKTVIESSSIGSSGIGTASSSSSSSSAATTATNDTTCSNGKFKSYLMHFVLSSNIPFAYAIILVAFLITVIAATSIITILTIVLTITGYTAYPITENTFNTSLAIGVVCASFALALVTALLVVWRRHCQAAYYYLDDPQSASRGTNSPQLSETYDDTEYGSIAVSDWAKHVQKLHSDGDEGFRGEFERIQSANSYNLTYDHSQMIENKHKNRYINIVAYDHTRVILRPIRAQKKPGSDYINANFIDGYNKPRAYIGTQGPLVSTFDDYWRMIWEQRVIIIVMITNLQERGRRKCDMYWPKEGTETYGDVQVKLLQEAIMATYTLRTFTVKNLKMKRKAGSERTVYQYHYTNWPDHGVPDHPLPVLSFIRKSASANPSGAGAIICHCSAGCGRSGTYIVIDAMLKQIRHRQSINVVGFLKHIRSQRNFLVQTEEQYIFIHDAIVEAIESGETEISSNFLKKYLQLLQTGGAQQQVPSSGQQAQLGISQKSSTYSISNGLTSPNQQALSVVETGENQLISSQNNLLVANGTPLPIGASKTGSVNTMSRSQSNASRQWSLLERQYRMVASFKAKDYNIGPAVITCNKHKNRSLNFAPLVPHRVHITPKPGIDGSDYINATFLMGFNHLREFIVTQHPLYETFSDFWQMVYDHNSQTIVLLTQMNDNSQEFAQFWPQKEDEVDYGSFKVKLTQESTISQPGAEKSGLIVTRDFIMRSNQDDYELQTRIIHCPGWPESCGPLSRVFDLIKVVQDTTLRHASRLKMHDGTRSTTVTIGQEHEPQNGGPVIVVDRFGGTEAATFAVLTTLFKQINFEGAVDVYMYAKLAHLRRPGIWCSQDDYLFLYRAIENYATTLQEADENQQSLLGSSSPNISFHNQTMTLDRHRHRSSANLLKTSTMRRPLNSSGNQNASANSQKLNMISDMSKSQLLIDHNHNHNQMLNANLQQQLKANQIFQRSFQQNQKQPQQANNQMQQAANYKQQQLLQQQQQKSTLPNSSISPYNSANSIGAGSHQHLMAASDATRNLGPAGQFLDTH